MADIGNVVHEVLSEFTPTWQEVSANTTEELTVTVPGLNINDFVRVSKPTHQAGVGVVGARVSATDTLAVTFMNATGSGITPTASETWKLFTIRSEVPLRTNAVN